MKFEDVLTCLVVVLAFFGILFLGSFIHDLFHVLDVGGATAVCLSFNAKINNTSQKGYIYAFTEYDMSRYEDVVEFNTLRELSEKYVAYVGFTWNIALGLLLGFWLKGRIDKRGGLKG